MRIKSMLLIMVQSNILNLKEVAVKAGNNAWITKKEVEPWRDDSYIVCQGSCDAGVSWSTNEYAKKNYYEHLKDYQVNTLHSAFIIVSVIIYPLLIPLIPQLYLSFQFPFLSNFKKLEQAKL